MIQAVGLDVLADGGDDASGGQGEFRAGDGHRPRATAGIGWPQFHSLTDEVQLSLLALQSGGGDEEFDLDPLGLRRLHFFHEARHLAARAAVKHPHRAGAQAHGATAGVHRGVAAAHHNDISVNRGGEAVRDRFQELQGGGGKLFTRAPQAAGALRADGQEYGIEVAPQVVQGQVAAQPPAQVKFGAQGADRLDFRIEHLPGQTKGRDAIAQHPAGLRMGIEQRHRVSLAQQVMRGGQPRRAGSDDGHPPAGGRRRRVSGRGR